MGKFLVDGCRQTVGAVILNRRGRVLMGLRPWKTHGWELPQGGVRQGESDKDAIWREIQEELGLTSKSLSLIGVMDERLFYASQYTTHHYGARGQQVRWFFFIYDGSEKLKPCRHEYRQCRWRAPKMGCLKYSLTSHKSFMYEQVMRAAGYIFQKMIGDLPQDDAMRGGGTDYLHASARHFLGHLKGTENTNVRC